MWSRCLPRYTDDCININFVNCGSDSGFPRHLCSRIDLGVWFPSSLGSNSFTVHRYCVDQRSQSGSGRFGFHCGVSAVGDWLSDTELGERNKFRRGAMVGGHCCLNVHEYGMVWSGNVGWDCRRRYIRPVLVWSGQPWVGSMWPLPTRAWVRYYFTGVNSVKYYWSLCGVRNGNFQKV